MGTDMEGTYGRFTLWSIGEPDPGSEGDCKAMTTMATSGSGTRNKGKCRASNRASHQSQCHLLTRRPNFKKHKPAARTTDYV
jgi:hypothetical protein